MTERTLLALVRPTLLALLALFCIAAMPATAADQPWDQAHDYSEEEKPDPPGPCEGELCDPCKSTGSPVYVPTGHFIWSETDVILPGRPSLGLSRTYNSHDPHVGQFGNGWTANCGIRLIKTLDSQIDAHGNQERTASVALISSNGKRYRYQRSSEGKYLSLSGRTDTITDSGDGGLILTTRGGDVTEFDQTGRAIRKQEPSGRSTSFTYSDSGQLTRIADDSGRYVAFTYDARGLAEAMTDHAGREWRYEYDENANLISVTDPAGGVTRYEYEAFTPTSEGFTYYQLTKIIDSTDVVIHQITYEEAQVESYTSGANIFTYSYDRAARKVRKTDSLNSRWEFFYNTEQVITQLTDPMGAVVNYSYDANGNLTTYIDQGGNTWSATFDEQMRKRSYVTPLGHTTEYSYSTNFPVATQIKTPTGREIFTELDTKGNIIRTTNNAGESVLLQWSEQGDLLKVTDPLGEPHTFTYNPNGLVSTSVDATGNSIHFAYDKVGNLIGETSGAGETTAYEYDTLNRVTAVIDPLGRRTTYFFDKAGRILMVTAANGESVSYTYDEFGRLASRTNFDGTIEATTYRSDNLPATITNADGTTQQYTFDSNKRLIREQTGNLSTSYEYDARHLLIKATNEAGAVVFTHDAEGRRTKEINNAEVQYSFNAEGELITSSALGRTEAFTYSNSGLVSALTTPEGKFGFNYDSISRRTELSYPDGSRVNYSFDKANRLIRQVFTGRFEKVFDYDYDNAGRLSAWSGDGPDRNYGYDAASQVISVTDHLGSYSFSYDALGNITSNGGKFDAANRLLENNTHTFSYDGRGNMIEKRNKETGARVVYTWNARNELITLQRFDSAEAQTPASITTYTYGPFGLRWTRGVGNNTEHFVYRGDHVIAILDDNGTALAHHSFGPGLDEPLMRVDASGAAYYFSDYLGSVQAVGGADLVEYDYSAYGIPQGDGLTTHNSFTYTAREYEGGDLYYYRNRYYDAQIGMFVQSDPIGLDGGINTYSYALRNPVINTDPYGLDVYLCKQPAFGISKNPVDHHWIVTDKYSSGMGPVKSDCGDAGNQSGDWPGDPVQTCDHSKRNMDGAVCQKLNNVDEDKVNDMISPGQSLGNWLPWNQCQSFARDVINEARTGCRQTRRGRRCPSVF